MPIDLSAAIASAATPTATALGPKWFHPDLTGNGKGIGLVNARLTPVNQPKPVLAQVDTHNHGKIEIDSDHSARIIPVGIVPESTTAQDWVQDTGRGLLEIESLVPDVKVFLGITPQTGILHYDRDVMGNASRKLLFRYRLELYITPVTIPLVEGSPVRARWMTSGAGVPVAGLLTEPVSLTTFASTEIRARVDDLLDACPVAINLDLKALEHWLDNYSLFDQLSELARLWNEPTVGELLSAHLNSLMLSNVAAAGASARYWENHNVPLEAYGTVNAGLLGSDADQSFVRHQNLNLLMYATLNDLVAVKSQLPVPPMCTQPKGPRASDEQWAATTSVEPLTLVAAGAGSGKTTVIMARIAYLQSIGIDLSDVLVLSFTNAAASNIVDRNPGVKSLTIAAMILDIYGANHPTHRISAIDTIVNSLRIFPCPNPGLDERFAQVLKGVEASAQSRNRASAPMVDLASFVQENLDWVLDRLDTISQTCLELTMIISYLTRDTSVIPPTVVTEYLIVDEVQDTSLFEFAFLMTFAREQRANLFIVGDPSQTLYEFRGTDPRALMILANNPDFVNFALNTNYRSNQQILDFANVQLNGLETNHGLDIQLRSNQLASGSEAEFLRAVQLRTVYTRSEQQFTKDLAAYTDSVVVPYVEACLGRGEQVAVIAPTRRMGSIMEMRLKDQFPNARLDNITSARRVPNQIFSRFIRKQWNDVVAIGPTSASLAIVKLISTGAHLYGPRWGDTQAKAKALQEFLSKWWIDQAPIINALVAHQQAGAFTEAEFFNRLRDLLLDYEIAVNAAAQVALQLRNQLRKQMPGQPDIVVSTIHGVKGLEFDNVVVVNNEADNLVQSQKRLAYVALTRAKVSELILAFRTTKSSLLADAHHVLAKLYWRQDVLEARRAAGIDVDLLTEDELNDLFEDAEKTREVVDVEVAA